MTVKYPLPIASGNTALPRLITNDLYLAAFLLCAGEHLCRLEHNGRRRISFVFAGERVKLLREQYQSGTVRLNMRSFRNSLKTVRAAMSGIEPEQRSDSHGTTVGKQLHT
jgi:hypothetical protein